MNTAIKSGIACYVILFVCYKVYYSTEDASIELAEHLKMGEDDFEKLVVPKFGYLAALTSVSVYASRWI